MSQSSSSLMFSGVYQFALVGAVGVTAVISILLCLRRHTLERRRLQNLPPHNGLPLDHLALKPRLYDAYLDGGRAEFWHDIMPLSFHPVGSWALHPIKQLDATPLVSTLSTVGMIIAMPDPLSRVTRPPESAGDRDSDDDSLPHLEFGVTDIQAPRKS
ncbi:hypothetical protein MSAN_02071400 [Mycena sanguinolenta]|uniref:Uncharacterized protein n=1 Tax=Mycena sanguinolenta TaxID=230812 RepID=A0A8H7CMT9_9AGAR|nr:hypothetical protein MSAN_02071400 [Mycena sanguinolenta]